MLERFRIGWRCGLTLLVSALAGRDVIVVGGSGDASADVPQGRIITRGSDADAKSDGTSFAGTFTSKSLTLRLRSGGGGNDMSMYLGTLTIDGQDYLVTASQKGSSLEGTFGAINAKAQDRFKFTASIKGDALTLNSDSQDFKLQREKAAKPNPLTKAKTEKPEPRDKPKIEIIDPDDEMPDDAAVTGRGARPIDAGEDGPDDAAIFIKPHGRVGPDDENDEDGAIALRPVDPHELAVTIRKPDGTHTTTETGATAVRSHAETIQRLRQAVIRNRDGKAAIQLGDLLAKGTKESKANPLEACVWYSVADDLDEPAAPAKNKAMAEKLTDEQLVQVDAKAEAILKEIDLVRGGNSGKKPAIIEPGEDDAVILPPPPSDPIPTLKRSPTVKPVPAEK